MKRLVIVLAGGLIIAAGWCLFARTRLGRHLEWRFYDWHMRHRPPRPWTTPAGAIRIIAIDDDSMRTLGRWQDWPRRHHAALLQVLSHPDYRPKAIGYDIAFLRPDTKNPQSDAALVQTVRANGAVCLGYHFEFVADCPEREPAPDAPPPSGLSRVRLTGTRIDGLWRCADPRSPWAALAEAGWLGFFNAPRDDDGVLRRLPLVLCYRDCALPSLALATVLRAAGRAPGEAEVVPGRWVRFTPAEGDPVRIPIDRNGRALVNFPGRWDTADVTSFADVLRWAVQVQRDGNDTAAKALAAFKDTIVFVGMVYTSVPDVAATPVDEAWPGVGVHAAAAHGLLSRSHLRESPLWVNVAMAAVVSLAAAALATWPRSRWGVPGMVLLLAGAWYGGWGLFTAGRVVWTGAPLAAGVTGFAALTVFRQVVTERRRRRLRRLFGQYLSPEAVKEIVDHADHLALGGRRVQAVVLFSDLRGFTALTERLGAPAIVEVLNEYFEAMTEVIQKHGGAVNKFVGDEVFATFGIPMSHRDDALRAVRAGIEMQQRLAAMRRLWHDQGRPELRMGIGISRGEIVAGTIGSERRKDYTAIGDAVNLGARLQELTKTFNEHILVGPAIWEDVRGAVSGRELDEVAIRGRTAPMRVYAIDVPE